MEKPTATGWRSRARAPWRAVTFRRHAVRHHRGRRRRARGRLELNRPDKLNPLSSHTLREIEAAARWFDGHDELKVVVVSGSRPGLQGRCRRVLVRRRGRGERSPRDDADIGWRMARAMDEMRAVTVAKVQGWCVGGGVVLAGVCDLRVAARSARFSIPEVELGIPLAWGGIPRLVREIGPALTEGARHDVPRVRSGRGQGGRLPEPGRRRCRARRGGRRARRHAGADAEAGPAVDEGPHQRGQRGDGRHRSQLGRRRRPARRTARPGGPGVGGELPPAGAPAPNPS